MAPPVTVFLHHLSDLPHVPDDLIRLVAHPNVVEPSDHQDLNSVWHVEVIFKKGPLHVSHLPTHDTIDIEVQDVCRHLLVPDAIHCARGEHNPPSLTGWHNHKLRDMANGAHVGSSLVLHLHVQEHAPGIPGGEVVVVNAGGGVRAHGTDLVTVLILPRLAVHQCHVVQGDVRVPEWPCSGSTTLTWLSTGGTGASVLICGGWSGRW